jgi:uncharacterized membrane protein
MEVFSKLRVWDTQHNNGVLIFVLLADRAVEIVADRGIHECEGAATWNAICRQIEAAFARAQYQSGALVGIEAIARTLGRHFPHRGAHINELPDEPVCSGDIADLNRHGDHRLSSAGIGGHRRG